MGRGDLFFDDVAKNTLRLAIERGAMPAAATPLGMKPVAAAHDGRRLAREHVRRVARLQADPRGRRAAAALDAPGRTLGAVRTDPHFDLVVEERVGARHGEPAAVAPRPLGVRHEAVLVDPDGVLELQELDWRVGLVGDVGTLALHAVLVGAPAARNLVEPLGEHPAAPRLPSLVET